MLLARQDSRASPLGNINLLPIPGARQSHKPVAGPFAKGKSPPPSLCPSPSSSLISGALLPNQVGSTAELTLPHLHPVQLFNLRFSAAWSSLLSPHSAHASHSAETSLTRTFERRTKRLRSAGRVGRDLSSGWGERDEEDAEVAFWSSVGRGRGSYSIM